MKTTMNKAKYRLTINLILVLSFLTLLGTNVYAQDNKLTVSGFSELTFQNSSGDPANADDLEKFETLGGNEELVEDGQRMSLPGLSLIFTKPFNDKLTMQSEIAYIFEEGELDIELLRTYIDYKINSKFNLQAGKFLSPIGYLNRNQRFYGYLYYSAKPRDMVDKEQGFVPLSTLGLKAYGSFEVGSVSSFSWQLGYGGMRGIVPEASEVLSEFEIGEEDESNSPGVSGLVEFLTFKGETEILVGFSAYSVARVIGFYVEDGEEVEYGEEADEEEEDGLLDREEMELSEFGIAPYVRIDAPKFQIFGEYHSTKFTDEIGNLDESEYDYSAYTLEFVYKTTLAKKPFYPYVRFDSENVADGDSHPYYGLELEGGDELENSYAPSSKELFFGFAWDVITNNRIKVEYGKYLAGPFPSNAFRVSTAFAF